MVREYFVAGEVGLNGKVQPVNGILPMVAEAKERGMKNVWFHGKCRRGGIGIGHAGICRKNLADAVNILNGNGEYFDTPYNIEEMQTGRILDFADVSGQELVKRACETAVSGMHNLLLSVLREQENNDRRADSWNFTFVKYKRTHGTF